MPQDDNRPLSEIYTDLTGYTDYYWSTHKKEPDISAGLKEFSISVLLIFCIAIIASLAFEVISGF